MSYKQYTASDHNNVTVFAPMPNCEFEVDKFTPHKPNNTDILRSTNKELCENNNYCDKVTLDLQQPETVTSGVGVATTLDS